MNKPEGTDLFDLYLSIMERGGPLEPLLGDSAPAMRKVYEKLMLDRVAPSVYFEFPLLGKPCSDILFTVKSIPPGTRFINTNVSSLQPMIDWLSTLSGNRNVGCCIELDTGAGQNEQAGVYFQDRSGTALFGPFLESIGESRRLKPYMETASRLPDKWPPAYIGLFPHREGSPTRIGGYLKSEELAMCGSHPDHLGRCFERIGFAAFDSDMLGMCSELMAFAQGADFQFDILEDGTLSDVFGLSISFNHVKPREAEAFMANGPGSLLMHKLEELGLVDDRWKLLAGTTAGLGFPVETDGKRVMMGIATRFNYLKIKFKAGQALPAKFYILAGSKIVSE